MHSAARLIHLPFAIMHTPKSAFCGIAQLILLYKSAFCDNAHSEICLLPTRDFVLFLLSFGVILRLLSFAVSVVGFVLRRLPFCPSRSAAFFSEFPMKQRKSESVVKIAPNSTQKADKICTEFVR